MKKVLSLMLTLLLCFTFSATASAKTTSSYVVQPYYEKAQEAKSILNINGTDAICESSLAGDPDVIKIVAVQTLEKQGFLWIWGTYDGHDLDKDSVYKRTDDDQHENGSVKRKVSSENGFHAYGQGRKKRDNHSLQ